MIDRIRCWLGDHDWTCDANENIGPPDINMDNVAAEFFRYSRSWCKRCRHYMKPHERLVGSEHWDASVTYRPKVYEHGWSGERGVLH